MKLILKNTNGEAFLEAETIELEQPTPEPGQPIQAPYPGQMLVNEVRLTRIGNNTTAKISRSEIFRFAQAITNNTI